MPEFITDRLLLHTGSCYINTSLLVMKLKIESQFISCHACLDIYVISISLFSLLLKEIILVKIENMCKIRNHCAKCGSDTESDNILLPQEWWR